MTHPAAFWRDLGADRLERSLPDTGNLSSLGFEQLVKLRRGWIDIDPAMRRQARQTYASELDPWTAEKPRASRTIFPAMQTTKMHTRE